MSAAINMYPCLLLPDGTETRVKQTNYAEKLNGTAAPLDGSEGNLVMRYDAFYSSFSMVDGIVTVKNSSVPFGGGAINPGFSDGSKTVEKQYIGIYPAVWFDVSASAYVDGNGVNTAFDANADKIGSVAGKLPLTGNGLSTLRNAATRVGFGWHILDAKAMLIIQYLLLSQLGSFRFSEGFGDGNTRFTGSFSFSNMISETGKVLGMPHFGQCTDGGNKGDHCQILGLELMGGIWEYCDGIKAINTGTVSICQDHTKYAVDAAYTTLCPEPSAQGLQKNFVNSPWLYPNEVTTNLNYVTSFIGAYVWRSAANAAVLKCFGDAISGFNGGPFTKYMGYSVGVPNIGSRLCYTPPN